MGKTGQLSLFESSSICHPHDEDGNYYPKKQSDDVEAHRSSLHKRY